MSADSKCTSFFKTLKRNRKKVEVVAPIVLSVLGSFMLGVLSNLSPAAPKLGLSDKGQEDCRIAGIVLLVLGVAGMGWVAFKRYGPSSSRSDREGIGDHSLYEHLAVYDPPGVDPDSPEISTRPSTNLDPDISIPDNKFPMQ